MVFTHDAEIALESAVALINTAPVRTPRSGEGPGPLPAGDADALTTIQDLDVFIDQQRFTGARTHNVAELRSVRQLRAQLREIWTAPEEEAVRLTNLLLANARALPQLVKHDQWDWHLHATTAQAPLALRMGTEAAMALVDVIRGKELDRLRCCAASDCSAAVLDLSRNRSRRFCGTGNCANRTHVAAYRRRKTDQGL
ncbi:CGNR zinc finger domain-containing protein [Paeniglutamicibacter antarcticus]|uniref:CGNR zinc finger domain-containing protein n=1 Tax=Arthrobacter terrae TaxID=2935737 RepID=A0A931GBJ8_9MICC|nr:CGNR zinc finger domain-containing protein [Arthrobacter terrae]MBG0740817.1 CGNR zinc finger domain-containing protein [Arthrobacter terrae]